MTIGYKILRAGGTSLNGKFCYPLPAADGRPGPWVEVPGNGAYVSKCGVGIGAGGDGPLLVELEVQGPTWLGDPPEGVACYRRVRVLREVHTLPLRSVPGDLFLSGCTGLTALPDGLSVSGRLYLYGCTGLTALPDRLSVGEWLDLGGCTGLTALPDRLSIGRDLCLDRCTSLIGDRRPGWVSVARARKIIKEYQAEKVGRSNHENL